MVREPNRITQKIVALCNLEYCQLSYSERAKSKAEYYKLQVVFFFCKITTKLDNITKRVTQLDRHSDSVRTGQA